MLSSVWGQLFGKKDDEYEAHPVPKLSTKQQIKIVQELREHATQKLARKRKKKTGKVVPINGNLEKSSVENRSSGGGGENLSRSPSSHSSMNELSKSAVMKNDEQIRNDSKDERSLKLALTHPTISKFLKDWMIAQGCGDLLDFYLDIVEIRSRHRRFLHKEAYDLWIMLATKVSSESITSYSYRNAYSFLLTPHNTTSPIISIPQQHPIPPDTPTHFYPILFTTTTVFVGKFTLSGRNQRRIQRNDLSQFTWTFKTFVTS